MRAFLSLFLILSFLLSGCSQTAAPSPTPQPTPSPSPSPAPTATPDPQSLFAQQLASAQQAGYWRAADPGKPEGPVITMAELDMGSFTEASLLPLSPDGNELGINTGENTAFPRLDTIYYRNPATGELSIYSFSNTDGAWNYYTNHGGPVLKVPASLPADLADLVGVYSAPDRDPALVAAKLMPDGSIQIIPIVFVEGEDVAITPRGVVIGGEEMLYNALTGEWEALPATPFEIQDGRIYERRENGELVEAKIFYDQFPYIKVSEVRDAGGGAYEAYDGKGRLMFVKPGVEMTVGSKTIGADEWIFAPFGIVRIDGFWKEWGQDADGKQGFVGGVVETQQKFENQAAVQVLIDFVNNELRGEFQPGIMQPLSPAMTNGMEVAPGKAEQIYLEYLEAWANAKHSGIRKYLRDAFGYTGGGLEAFIKAIDQSTGPNGEKRWFPMMTENGTPFMDAQGADVWNADIKTRTFPKDGAVMDGLLFVFVGFDEWQNNPLAKAFLTDILRKNRNEQLSHFAFGGSIDVSNAWGIQFDPKAKRPIFFLANFDDQDIRLNKALEHYFIYLDGFHKKKSEDERMGTAFWRMYLYILSKLGMDVRDESRGRLCIESEYSPNCRPVITIDSIYPDDILFKYQD